jgi:hypothetical protein
MNVVLPIAACSEPQRTTEWPLVADSGKMGQIHRPLLLLNSLCSAAIDENKLTSRYVGGLLCSCRGKFVKSRSYEQLAFIDV